MYLHQRPDRRRAAKNARLGKSIVEALRERRAKGDVFRPAGRKTSHRVKNQLWLSTAVPAVGNCVLM